MLRRDFETFFLGTAMTISRTGAPLACAKLGCAPKKATAALYRRGGPTSLAKTLQPRNNLAAAARFVPQGRQTGKRVPALLISARPAALAGLGQHVFQLYSRPPRIGLGRQGQLFSDDLADIAGRPRKPKRLARAARSLSLATISRAAPPAPIRSRSTTRSISDLCSLLGTWTIFRRRKVVSGRLGEPGCQTPNVGFEPCER